MAERRGNSGSGSSGIGFLGMLAILFIALKLTGFIGWSWWWVTAPLWGIPAFLLAPFVVGFTLLALIWLWEASRLDKAWHWAGGLWRGKTPKLGGPDG